MTRDELVANAKQRLAEVLTKEIIGEPICLKILVREMGSDESIAMDVFEGYAKDELLVANYGDGKITLLKELPSAENIAEGVSSSSKVASDDDPSRHCSACAMRNRPPTLVYIKKYNLCSACYGMFNTWKKRRAEALNSSDPLTAWHGFLADNHALVSTHIPHVSTEVESNKVNDDEIMHLLQRAIKEKLEQSNRVICELKTENQELRQRLDRMNQLLDKVLRILSSQR